MYKKLDRVDVYVWGNFVGAVALDPQLGFYVFAYDKNFGKSGIELSPLHMPLNDTEEPFVFTDLPEMTYKRLPALLADSLPDDFGSALIDRYMAEQGISKQRVTALDRLAYMGKRSMGALEFKPTRGPAGQKSSALEMKNLVNEARKAVSGKIDDDLSAHAALRSIIDVGTSAGGARAKAIIAWNPKTEEIRSGQLDAPVGFEHWLLKFDGMGQDNELGVGQNYGRIEYAYYLMATKAGIKMNPCRLLLENGRAHFMTKRFDRDGNKKHHMQTLCAMNHLDYKKKSTNSYEQLFTTIKELSLPKEDKEEAFRRMIFNVMSKNCDDHTKNFSFILKQNEKWRLSPAYDITFAHNPNGQWTNQHLMSVNGKYKNILLSDIKKISEKFKIAYSDKIIEQVVSAINLWSQFAQEAGLGSKEIEEVKIYHELFEV